MKTVQSYPNFSDYMNNNKSYNLGKWMDAMKEVYIKMHLGSTKNAAVAQITKDFPIQEKTEFLDWMRYYESGDHTKYKRAQMQPAYYVNDDINYFLPNPIKSPIPSPIKSENDQITAAKENAAAQVEAQRQAAINSKEEQRKLVEDQRRKILGRLNSAEKLLSCHQGQMFAGPDFERLLIAIYELKKQIQTVNKVSLSMQTTVDLIVRQANVLKKEGFDSASEFFVKFAQQTPGDFSMDLGSTPAGGSQPQGGGALGNNTPDLSMGGTAPSGDDGGGGGEITDDSAIGMFMDNMEDGGLTDFKDVEGEGELDDESGKKDEFSAADDNANDVVDFDLNDVSMGDDWNEVATENDEGELVVEAQAVGDDLETATSPSAKKPVGRDGNVADNKNLDQPANELTVDDVRKRPGIVNNHNDYDAVIDAAFKNITIQDVVDKLEDINNIFKTREIPRQIAIADLMLSRLGIAQYFIEISEILNKNLDSSQYSLLRLQNVISRLRGSIQTESFDLDGKGRKLSPENEAIRTNLEQSEQKENQRKEVKKQLTDQSDFEKATKKPEGTVENPQAELAAEPVEVESPATQPKI